MSRPTSETTRQIQAIAKESGYSPKYIRQLNREKHLPLSPLSAALEWLNHRPEPPSDGDSAAALRRERIKLTRAQVQKAELDLQIRRGEFIAREEVDRHFASAGQAVRALLLALERGIPAAVCGKGQTEMQGIVRGQLVVVMTKFRDGSEEFWKQHPQSE